MGWQHLGSSSNGAVRPQSRHLQPPGNAAAAAGWLPRPSGSKQCTQQRRQRCPEYLAAAAAAQAAAGTEPSQLPAAATAAPLIRLTRRKQRLSWQKWEKNLFQHLLQVDQEQVGGLVAPQCSTKLCSWGSLTVCCCSKLATSAVASALVVSCCMHQSPSLQLRQSHYVRLSQILCHDIADQQ